MIKINKIKPFSCRAYDPNGKYLGKLNEYEFNDLRIQIRTERAEGYYMRFNGEKIVINSQGKCRNWPHGFYDLQEEQLSKLMGF